MMWKKEQHKSIFKLAQASRNCMPWISPCFIYISFSVRKSRKVVISLQHTVCSSIHFLRTFLTSVEVYAETFHAVFQLLIVSQFFPCKHIPASLCSVTHNCSKVSHNWICRPVESPWHSKLNPLYVAKNSSYSDATLWGFHPAAAISHRNLLTSGYKNNSTALIDRDWITVWVWMAEKVFSLLFRSVIDLTWEICRLVLYISSVVNLIAACRVKAVIDGSSFVFCCFETNSLWTCSRAK